MSGENHQRRSARLARPAAIVALSLAFAPPPARATDFWPKTTIDADLTAGWYTSLAILPTGAPAISYQDQMYARLRYAWHDAGGWHTTLVDPEDSGYYTSLAILPSGQPAISYAGFDRGTGLFGLKYAWFDGAAWHIEPVELTGDSGFWTSLAILPTGEPAISHFARRPYAELRYAWHDAGGWHTTGIENVHFLHTLARSSLAILPDGEPAIAFHRGQTGDLGYAWHDVAGWHVSSVVGDGHSMSLRILPGGRPAISFYAVGDSVLRYAEFDGAAWQVTTVDATFGVGEHTSLTILESGRPAIAYFDHAREVLRYAERQGDSGWQWVSLGAGRWRGAGLSVGIPGERLPAGDLGEQLPTSSRGGQSVDYGNLDDWILSPIDLRPDTGRYVSLQTLPDGQPAAAYLDRTNADVVYTRRYATGDANCDGRLDFGDINAFVVALGGREVYEQRYPGCNWLVADCDDDGDVNFGDINPFVKLLSK